MDQFQKKEVVQAVLIADNNVEYFRPITDKLSTSLLPLVNIPLLDYALESLNRSGIEEVFVYARHFLNDVRSHIQKRIENCCTWSISMKVTVIGAEDCLCLGDALRDLDAKGLIRGYFVLMGADTVTNANLNTILEEHKKNSKFDKGAAMTVVFKEASVGVPTGDEVMIAMDAENNRLHYHERIKMNFKKSHFSMPLNIFLENSDIALYHNLTDPQIAICSPLFLTLFSDNFDFANRDDFIRGLLINEEILNSRIYVSFLPPEQYARKVSNWLTYQIVSNDVINRWAYPLVPDMGICCLGQNYIYLRNNIYKSHTANISKVQLKENVVIHANSSVEAGSQLSSCVIGKNCKVGKNCVLNHAFLFDDVVVEDDCSLQYCVIGAGSKISNNTKITEGIVVAAKTIVPPNSTLSLPTEHDGIAKRFSISTQKSNDTEELDSEDDELLEAPKMKGLPYTYEDSEYNSSEDEEESSQGSPIPDDTNIFLSEVIDSLTRGFNEKSNPDFLILEINSSRYAYNMTLKEVNFFVVKAVFSLSKIKEGPNVLSNLHQVFGHLGPVVTNYIKTHESMLDCLKAVEESCHQDDALKTKAAQIVHYLYDKEYVGEDAILKWYEELPEESQWLKASLKKLIEWLMASSEEESSEDE